MLFGHLYSCAEILLGHSMLLLWWRVWRPKLFSDAAKVFAGLSREAQEA
jgi:hypothetical protein